MCSDTEGLEMFFVLLICSFFMSFDSGDLSPGDCETVSGYIWCLITLFIWWFLYWVPFSIIKDSLRANEIFYQDFWHLKGRSANSVFFRQPRIHIFKSALDISQFTLLDFHIIPDRSLCVPGAKITLSCLLGNFWKFYIFPSQSSNIDRGIETGCYYQSCRTWFPIVCALKACLNIVATFTKYSWPIQNFAFISYFRKIIWSVVRFKTHCLSISLKFQKVISTHFQLKVTSRKFQLLCKGNQMTVWAMVAVGKTVFFPEEFK